MSSRHRPLARGDACKACKARKIRCPGERPTCTNCVKKKQQCIYTRPEDSITPPDTEYSSYPVEPSLNPPPTAHGNPPSARAHRLSESTASVLTPAAAAAAPDPTPHLSSFDGFDGLPSHLPLPPATSRGMDVDHMGPYSGVGGAGHMSGATGSGYDAASHFGFVSLMGIDGGQGDQQMPAEWADVDLHALLGDVAASANANSGTSSPKATVTETERDHLVWLFFTNQRVFGLEMHIATFYASLHSPEPAMQPHPCLLNAMYLVTCRASTSASLRKREVEFFEAARLGLNDAIGRDERLFDAVRAGTLVSTWLFNKGRFPEAVAIMGLTTRTASACGLDDIPSSSYRPLPQRRRTLEHHVSVYLPPPESQIELAERIYAFWAIFLVDRCATTAEDWGAGFHLSRIKTPLPRPWSEYETGDPHLISCEERIQDVFRLPSKPEEPQTKCDKDHSVDLGLIVKAVTIMHRASLVRCSSDPEEAHTVRHAIDEFARSLHVSLRAVGMDERGNKSISSRTATIQFLIMGAEMNLLDNDSDEIPNEGSLAAVRRMLGVMHLSGDAVTGDVSLFIIIIWVEMSRILVIEARRLERIGQAFEAASVFADVDFIIAALRRQGKRLSLAAFQADKVAEWREGKVAGIEWNTGRM